MKSLTKSLIVYQRFRKKNKNLIFGPLQPIYVLNLIVFPQIPLIILIPVIYFFIRIIELRLFFIASFNSEVSVLDGLLLMKYLFSVRIIYFR